MNGKTTENAMNPLFKQDKAIYGNTAKARQNDGNLPRKGMLRQNGNGVYIDALPFAVALRRALKMYL
jgi:hypothetical protein